MVSTDILERLKSEGAVKNKTSEGLNDLKDKIEKILANDRILEDSISKLKEQITKGKKYKFHVVRNSEGLISEIVAKLEE